MHLHNERLVSAGYEENVRKKKRKDELNSFLIELGYSENQSSKILKDETLFAVADLLDKYHHFASEKSTGEVAKKFCIRMNNGINPTKE